MIAWKKDELIFYFRFRFHSVDAGLFSNTYFDAMFSSHIYWLCPQIIPTTPSIISQVRAVDVINRSDNYVAFMEDFCRIYDEIMVISSSPSSSSTAH